MALSTRLATTTFEQGRIGGDGWQSFGDVDLDTVGAGAEAVKGGRHDLVECHRRGARSHRVGVDPRHVEQVADQLRQPVGLLLDRGLEPRLLRRSRSRRAGAGC